MNHSSPIAILILATALLSSSLSAFVPVLSNRQTKQTALSISYWGVSTAVMEKRLPSLRPSATRIYAEREDPVRIIIAGAPASGKGTQCEIIKEKFGVVHLSTGDMLRAAVAAETEVGKTAKDYMDSGMLVPDDVIIGVVSTLQNLNNPIILW